MAKKFFLLPTLAIFTLTIFSATFTNKIVLAQGSGNIQERINQARDMREDSRDLHDNRPQDLREKSATRQAQLRQRTVERIKKVFNKILSHFQAALERLDKIVAKLQSRINKLKEKGVDVSTAQSMLDACSAKKAQAESAVTDSRAKVAAIDPSSATVRQAVKTAVEAIHSAKSAIRSYHKCLSDVAKTLKALPKPKEATHGAE